MVMQTKYNKGNWHRYYYVTVLLSKARACGKCGCDVLLTVADGGFCGWCRRYKRPTFAHGWNDDATRDAAERNGAPCRRQYTVVDDG